MTEIADAPRIVKDAYARQRIDFQLDTKHDFPGETHLVLRVKPVDVARSIDIASDLEGLKGDDGRQLYIVVRELASPVMEAVEFGPLNGLQDGRCDRLIQQIAARSRVSTVQPSLAYVPDSRANMAAVTAKRHQLIFGRRGAGKTALLVEARARIDASGSLSSWTNIQTLRNETAGRVTLHVLDNITSALITARRVAETSNIYLDISQLSTRIKSALDEFSIEDAHVQRLIPRAQQAITSYLAVADVPLYVFMDDFYYVSRRSQPMVLDMIHGLSREANVWLKIASIRHLTRWWQASPPVGLQSGQDADIIDLDVTLQDPVGAKAFLEGVLLGFCQSVDIPALTRVFRHQALDRLLLASGAVPRDYLVLASRALILAQDQRNRRYVGVQEINKAAGDAASVKIQELEEDMASNEGVATRTLNSLGFVRSFCLDTKSSTYFLVSFRDRELYPEAYSQLTDLMDVRLVHLVDAGVSDQHNAGHRSEAFMLDLSQFSSSRLKQKIRVLDFKDGRYVSHVTRSNEKSKVARTARDMVAILRTAPALELERLSEGGGEDRNAAKRKLDRSGGEHDRST